MKSAPCKCSILVCNGQEHTKENVENHHYLCNWSLILLELILRIGYLFGSEIEATPMNKRKGQIEGKLERDVFQYQPNR